MTNQEISEVKLIGILGAAKSGKSTTAQYLVKDYGYHSKPLAGPLKSMLAALGLSGIQLYGNQKEVPCDRLCGKTPRYAMQTLGTEWRNMLGEALWTNIMEDSIKTVGEFDSDICIVIDDVRFEHEVEMIKRLGGETWCIRRAEVEPPTDLSQHPSELLWRHINADVTFINEATIADLHKLIDKNMGNYR